MNNNTNFFISQHFFIGILKNKCIFDNFPLVIDKETDIFCAIVYHIRLYLLN